MNRQEKKSTRYFKMLTLLWLCFVFWSIGVSAWSMENYPQSWKLDFNTDAPWRVQDELTAIPFVFAITDFIKIDNDIDELHTCRVWLIKQMSDRTQDSLIYSHDFNKLKIDMNTIDLINGNWEWGVNTFKNSPDWIQFSGQEITPTRLGYQKGGAIYFQTEISYKDELIKKTFRKVLKVQVGYPLPKPGNGWYYGDSHYHTEYTDNPYEYGGTLKSTQSAIKAMGLDWITTNDHASNYPDNDIFFGYWDLSDAAWSNLNKRVSELNDSSGLPFLVGEEITCQSGSDPKSGIHLLVYNNSKFIPGLINFTINPQDTLASRLELISAESDAFAYAAHPATSADIFFVGDINPWVVADYNTALTRNFFSGYQIWNTREDFETFDINEKDVNPFDNTGNWKLLTDSTWLSDLNTGIDVWDSHLCQLLTTESQPRKIFIVGGSDSHGDLNYFTSGIGTFTKANDNAAGKVRTLVYAPDGKKDINILSALKNGRSVVTDGPVCIFGIDQNGDGELTSGASNDVIIGDYTVLPVGKNLEFLIKWQSSLEFGNIDEIRIYRGSKSSTKAELIKTISVQNGQSGSYQWKQDMTMLPGNYYYRTESVIKNALGGIQYRCLTNPIWVTWANTSSVIFFDNFSNGLSNWTLYGSPSSKIVTVHGETAFDNNGNSWCSSGAISKQRISIEPGMTISAKFYIDVWDWSGCWTTAGFGLSDGVKVSSGSCSNEEYYSTAIVWANAVGSACWASPKEQWGHSFWGGGSLSVQGDQYINGWHEIRATIDNSYYLDVYVDNKYLGRTSQPIESRFLNNPYLYLGYRSANVGGKAYIDDVKVERSSTPSRAQFLGVWSDGVWTWEKSTNKWTKMVSTASALMISAGKVDGDTVEDLIGVWSSGLWVRNSSNGQWVKLSSTLPSWITAGDMNNDGRDDVIGSWKNDGVYFRDSANGKWVKITTPAKQLAVGNIGGTRDDLIGVWSDGLWARFSATGLWQKFDPSIPIWITAGDMSGDKRADIIGSYTSGTWYRNSATGAWTKFTTPAEQLVMGDLDGDGRDDLIGVWSNGVWIMNGATGKWQQITDSKPKWITTGRIAAAVQAAGSLDDPSESSGEMDIVDLSLEGPGGAASDMLFLEEDGPITE